MSARLLLEVEGLVAGYTGPVVGPVSFTLSGGEIVGLGGANGVGKSTVLGAITGTARRFGGSIRRASGLRIAHHRQRPERPAEIPLRARELIRLKGADPDDCPPWLHAQVDKPLDELSGGQYQFLHTWACLGGPADLVLLDEPTNNLDPDGIAMLTDLLRRQGPERAVLMVSHETDFLAHNCDRLIGIER